MAFLAHPSPATRVSAANVLPPAETPEAAALTALTALTPTAPLTSETSQTSARAITTAGPFFVAEYPHRLQNNPS